MDLIGGLSKAMGIDETAATALAGAVMGNVAAQAAESDVEGAGAKVEEAVPELGGWLDVAKGFVTGDDEAPAPEEDSGGMLGSLMGAASTGVGGQLLGAVAGKEARQAVLLGAVLQKIGLDQSKAMMAAPLALSFLKDRLDPVWVDKLLAAAPLLTGQMPQPEPAQEGGVMGALGGLFS
jgi:hypothetical protein